MSVARFQSRILDALGPLASQHVDLAEILSEQHALLRTSDVEHDPVHLAGFMLAVNLCARIFPKITIEAAPRVVDQATTSALAINPRCEVNPVGTPTASLTWGPAAAHSSDVHVCPSGWLLTLNDKSISRLPQTNILASLAAASVGVGELFRAAFRDVLRLRETTTEACWNILTLDDSRRTDLPNLSGEIDIGEVQLIGAGAIGQALVYALARLSLTGTLIVADPDLITESNLQRYVLTTDADVGAPKTALIARALRGSSLAVRTIQGSWPYRDEANDTLCVAVDSAATRIAIQSSLPRRIYNAWTQPADVGWSRHEHFGGDEPCLACLYWPTAPRPNQHELIATSIKQHEVRVLAYLANRVPVDLPLTDVQVPRLAGSPMPSELEMWKQTSILDSISHVLGLSDVDKQRWAGRLLGDLYREGICGGAIVTTAAGEKPTDVVVPLAHQSMLAGVLLAAELIIGMSPDLIKHRPRRNEARFDVLAPLPQVAVRPRSPAADCICRDADFVERYVEKWANPNKQSANGA